MTNELKDNKEFSIKLIFGYSSLASILISLAFINYLRLGGSYIGAFIFISGILLFLFSLYLASKKKFYLAKLILSITPPYFILAISIYVKLAGVLDDYYFYLLPRMVVILSLMGPVIFFGISQLKTMLYTLLIISLPILLFDEVHNHFGIHLENLTYLQPNYFVFKMIFIVIFSIPLLSLLLFQKAVLIQKVKLKSQNNELINDKVQIEELNTSLQIQANLYTILNVTSSNDSLNNILQKVLDELLQIKSIDIEQKGLIFITNKNGELEMVAQRNCDILLKSCKTIQKGQCLCGIVLESKKKLFCNSVGHDHTITPKGMKPHGHYVIPITYEKEVLGVLNLYIKKGEEESKEISSFLEAVANILARKIFSEKQKTLLKDKNDRISFQQNLLEATHNELTSSIEYAKTIQESLLANQETLNEVFSDSSVLFLPKDKISGDFYFAYELSNLLYFGIGDCTGHGISGGILAAMSIESVKTIIHSMVGIRPDMILEELRNLAKERFTTNKGVNKSDSMDAGFCLYDKQNDYLYFAGGFINLIIIRNNKLVEYKSNRCPVGPYPKEIPFELKKIKLQKNDILYLSSDGYQDQFGYKTDSPGSKVTKFKRHQFHKLLLDIHHLNCKNQTRILRDTSFNWRQNEEQTDDITVFILRHL